MLVQNLLELPLDGPSSVGEPLEKVVVLEGGETNGVEQIDRFDEGVVESFEDGSIGWSCR